MWESLSAENLHNYPDLSVFINCPFDNEYSERFDSLIYAIVCCGFLPRSALEYSVAATRIERILNAVFSSRFSIHDLSRCKGEGSELLARFNMPLELGFAIASQRHPLAALGDHDWLVLVPEGHIHERFVSDLKGFDPDMYDGSSVGLIKSVAPWLAVRPGAIPGIDSKSIVEGLPNFSAEKIRLTEKWGEAIPWHELILAARRTAPIV